MMEDFNYSNGNDSDGHGAGSVGVRTSGNDSGGGGSHHQWPTSSADIVEYDSSVAEDTPTLQQQHTQFLLPQQQQQRLRAVNNFSQKSGVAVPTSSNVGYAGKSAIMSTAAEHAANGGRQKSRAKWKTRALYVFLACLLAVVVINLTLTLWFIRVTQFTSVIICIRIIILRTFHSKRL